MANCEYKNLNFYEDNKKTMVAYVRYVVDIRLTISKTNEPRLVLVRQQNGIYRSTENNRTSEQHTIEKVKTSL